MSRKNFSATTWLVIGLVIGALVARFWQGGLIDTALAIIVVVGIILFALRTKQTDSLPDNHPSSLPLAESFDPNRHLIFARRDDRIVVRLQNIGRWQFVELALAVPSWFLPAREGRDLEGFSAAKQPPNLPGLLSLANQFRREHRRRATAILVAFALIFIVVLLLLAMPITADFTFVVILWLAAMVAYVGVIAQPAKSGFALSLPRIHSPTLRVPFTLIALIILAFALRIWQLGTIPFSLGGDEASQGLEALRVMNGDIRSPFITGWYSVPTMSFFFQSISLRLLGATITALRLPWVLVGTLTVLVSFGLVTRLAGVRIGLLTAALVAVYHYHIHFSRLGSNQIADPLFIALAFFFLYRALARRRAIDWMLAGAATAAALYFYAGARLTMILVLAVVGYEFLRDRCHFWRTHRAGLMIALGSFFIVAAPMLQFALRFPDDFNSRVNQVGIFQNGWIELAKQATGQSTPELLFDQFRRAALAFNFYPDRTVWYGLRQPLLDPIFGMLFLLGLGFATVSIFLPRGDRRLFPMVAWWWGATILGGMLTESPPSSMRLVTLTVPVCFFIALAAWKIIRLARQAIVGVPVNALMLITFGVFAAISIKTYFVDYTSQRIYGSVRAEAATTLAPVLRELSPTHRFYFVGAPFMYWGFATLPYLVPNAQVVDVQEPITSPPTKWFSADIDVVFVIVPERAPELTFIQQAFPQGHLEEIHSSANDQLLALLYIVDSPSN